MNGPHSAEGLSSAAEQRLRERTDPRFVLTYAAQMAGSSLNRPRSAAVARNDVRKLLNPKDQHYIVAHLFIGASLRAKLGTSAPPVHLSIEEAREIRDAATKRLAAVGFDAVDEANPEGRYLEALIERLSPI